MTNERYDLVVRGGTVYDGSGGVGFRADVGVRGDRMAEVGQIAAKGAVEIDATGLAVSPGFIDVHTHDDFSLLIHPEVDFKVMQGVTTVDRPATVAPGWCPSRRAWSASGRGTRTRG